MRQGKMKMDEEPVDIKNSPGFIFPAVISLAVGLMFFVPGMFFLEKAVSRFLERKEIPDLPFAFIIVFTLAIGTILLLLAYKFLFGNIEKQRISTPILTLLSLWFIGLGTAGAVLMFVFNAVPGAGRGVGAALSLGAIGLWFAYKRKRGTSNMRSDHDRA
jgi:divalent metal cation (Fe/Co/Zn/Cd) transporter